MWVLSMALVKEAEAHKQARYLSVMNMKPHSQKQWSLNYDFKCDKKKHVVPNNLGQVSAVGP